MKRARVDVLIKYVRIGLIAVSATLFLLIAFFSVSSGTIFNVFTLFFMAFFVTNAAYLLSIEGRPRSSRLLNILAGYFALAALELKHRAGQAQEKEAELAAIPPVEREFANSRLEAVEEFLQILASNRASTEDLQKPEAPKALQGPSASLPQITITASSPTVARVNGSMGHLQ